MGEYHTGKTFCQNFTFRTPREQFKVEEVVWCPLGIPENLNRSYLGLGVSVCLNSCPVEKRIRNYIKKGWQAERITARST